jgi:hypothetical protein
VVDQFGDREPVEQRGKDGDPSVTTSVNDNWAYALSEATHLYNHPDWWTAANSAMDVKHASRSVVWINPDYVVVYDRATTGKPNRFKRFNLVLMNKPAITGSIARISINGQTLTVQSLMPANATVREEHFWKTDPSQEFSQPSLLEMANDRLVIEDTANPSDVRFLTILQGTDASVSADQATAIHSTSGTPYDGAWFRNTSVVFPTTVGQTLTWTSYNLPSSITRHLITGLTPGTAYDVKINSGGGTTTVTVAPGTALVADIGGVIGIGFPASANPTQGGVVLGQALIGPSGSASGGSGGGTGGSSGRGTCSGSYTKAGSGYTGCTAPNALVGEGIYFYDTVGKRVYWQHNGQWVLIADGGGTTVYTKTGTTYTGEGAPHQLIADGASYYDTVETRTYTQQGGSWVLIPLTTANNGARH